MHAHKGAMMTNGTELLTLLDLAMSPEGCPNVAADVVETDDNLNIVPSDRQSQDELA